MSFLTPFIFCCFAIVGLHFVSLFFYKINRLPSAVRLFFCMIIASSLLAIYATGFHTVLVPFLGLNLVSLYLLPSQKYQKGYGTTQYIFAIILFSVLVQLMLYYDTPNGNELIMHRDFINNFICKNFSIRITGIEDNNVSLYHEKGVMHPNFYHFSDIWSWNFFIYFRKYFTLNQIFFQIALPLLLTLLSALVFDVLQSINKVSRSKLFFISLLVPIIVPISYLAFGQSYYLGFIFSALNQAKFIFIGLNLAFVLFYYFSDGKYAFYLSAIACGIGFINLVPALGFFVLSSFVFSIYYKELSLQDKAWKWLLLALLLALAYLVWHYLPQIQSGNSYVSDQVKQNITFQEKLVRRLAIVRDVFYVLAMYIPYFLPIFFFSRAQRNQSLKDVIKFYLPFTLLIGGGFAWLILHYLFFDSNQFFYNIFPFLMAFYIVYFYLQIKSKTAIAVSFVSVLVLASFINAQYPKNTFNYKEHPGVSLKEIEQLNLFCKDKKPLKTAYLTFDGRDTKHFTEYLIGDYFWYLINNSPFVSTFLDDKNQEQIKKDYKQVNQILIAAQNTPYGRLGKMHPDWTTAQKQIYFIQTKGVQYLTVEKNYPLSGQVKKLAKDSIYLTHAKLNIYRF